MKICQQIKNNKCLKNTDSLPKYISNRVKKITCFKKILKIQSYKLIINKTNKTAKKATIIIFITEVSK